MENYKHNKYLSHVFIVAFLHIQKISSQWLVLKDFGNKHDTREFYILYLAANETKQKRTIILIKAFSYRIVCSSEIGL